MPTRRGTKYGNATIPQTLKSVKPLTAKGKQLDVASTSRPAPETNPGVEVGTETDIPQSTTETLNSKTKEELIAELATLINAENKTDAGTCNSDKIKNMLNGFIDKYKPAPVAVPVTNKDIGVVIDVYADKDKNSKGYHIYNYKVRAVNEEYPFSTDDEVKYYLKHLFGYIENSNLPVEARKEDMSNFFRSYRKTIKEMPTLDEQINKKPIEGGNKKKSRAKRSQKRKLSNTQKKRGSRKSVKKH